MCQKKVYPFHKMLECWNESCKGGQHGTNAAKGAKMEWTLQKNDEAASTSPTCDCPKNLGKFVIKNSYCDSVLGNQVGRWKY